MGDDSPSSPSPSPPHDLVLHLSSHLIDDVRAAAMELRKLAKTSSVNRIFLAQIGAIPRLLELLASPDKETQTHAITALFNLTLRNDTNKVAIAKGMEAVVNVLLKGAAVEARENAAALVCNLSKLEDGKEVMTMADMEDVYVGLVGVLRDGSSRGKRDAAAAMYNLLLMSKRSSDMAVRANAIDALVHIVQDGTTGLTDECLALLTYLSGHHHEARCELRTPYSLQCLLGLLKDGSPPTKESACALLLLLCRHSSSASNTLLMLGALNPLSDLAQCGTDRARRKAVVLLELL